MGVEDQVQPRAGLRRFLPPPWLFCLGIGLALGCVGGNWVAGLLCGFMLWVYSNPDFVVR